MKFNTLDFEPDLNRVVRLCCEVRAFSVYLILQVVPPVRPSLLDASLLFENRLFDDCTQNAKRHCYSVVVVTVNAGPGLEFGNGLPVNFETII